MTVVALLRIGYWRLPSATTPGWYPSCTQAAVLQAHGPGFPGLYAMELLEQPFLANRLLLINTEWRSQATTVTVNVDTGKLDILGDYGSDASSLMTWTTHDNSTSLQHHGSLTVLAAVDGACCLESCTYMSKVNCYKGA